MKKATNNRSGKHSFFDRLATKVSKLAGSTGAFSGAFAIVVIWAISGPFFNYSETWQLVINTGTTIITFLMVFIIQKAQNKDGLAIQLKLNELVAASSYASNRLVDVEDMTEEEMMVIQKYYVKLSKLAEKEESLQQSHSIDEAEEQHEYKDQKQEQRDAEREAKKKAGAKKLPSPKEKK